MVMLNVSSLVKHLDESRLMLLHKKLDVLAINETRLDSTISDGLANIDGYNVLRADRNRNGGGVCIYIRCQVNYTPRPDLVATDFNAVCVKINQANSQSFIIVSIYILPCSTSEVFKKIKELIKLIDDESKELYIFGHLNCNMLQLNLSTTKWLQEIMELYQLTQLIDSPTRITNSSQSLLDVAITSTPEKIISSGVVHLGRSDHSLIYAVRILNTRVNTKEQGHNFVEFRNFENFDAARFLDDLHDVPWEDIRYKRNKDDMWKLWKTYFLGVLDKRAPKKVKKPIFLGQTLM